MSHSMILCHTIGSRLLHSLLPSCDLLVFQNFLSVITGGPECRLKVEPTKPMGHANLGMDGRKHLFASSLCVCAFYLVSEVDFLLFEFANFQCFFYLSM